MYLLYWLLLITVIVGGESSWTESDAHHTLVLGPGDHVVARNTVSMLTVHGGTTSSRALSNLIVKSSDFMHCSPYWVLLFRFREQFPTLKLKRALWFAAAIGNIISWHGRWAHPYPGISPTFWCSTFRTEVFQALIPIDPLANLDAMSTYLLIPCEHSTDLRMEWNFFTWFLELVLPPAYCEWVWCSYEIYGVHNTVMVFIWNM